MSTIPTSVTEEQFQEYILPYLETAKRGYVSRAPLWVIFNAIVYRHHTGCQWAELPRSQREYGPEPKIMSWQAVYHHFRKWSRTGCLERAWMHSIQVIRDELDTTQLNLDGSHAIAKKGGESVAYQGRKKAKTSNILPITDGNGFILASTGIVSGQHHDSYNLKTHLQQAFAFIKHLGISITGAFFNADSGFDTRDARRVCFNHQVIPNIAENKRNRKTTKRGRKRLFNAEIYKRRFTSERSFAWIDKFRALLVRFDRKDAHFLASHHLVFALINLRHRMARKAPMKLATTASNGTYA